MLQSRISEIFLRELTIPFMVWFMIRVTMVCEVTLASLQLHLVTPSCTTNELAKGTSAAIDAFFTRDIKAAHVVTQTLN